MSTSTSTCIERFLNFWGNGVLRFPLTLIFLSCVLSGFSLYYTIAHLGVNTNSSELLSPELPFQKNRVRMEKEFPQDSGAILFVVEALTPEESTLAAKQLEQRITAIPQHFRSVYIPTDNAFFRQQALLYLEYDELEELSAKLTDAQPFLGYLSQNFHLQGLFDIITQALKQQDDELPMDISPLLNAINDSVEDELQGNHKRLSWQSLLGQNKLNSQTNRTIVVARPIMDYNAILPAETSLNAARREMAEITTQYPAVNIRITGEIALEHEELAGVSHGAVVAGVVSLLLVCASLLIGLRSYKLLIATFFALIMGLILTAGFATVAIGHLNLISISFAVLYIGLGVDYAIHVCLHYRECLGQGMNNTDAIKHSISTVGVSIFLCALTTSIGFLAFIPTDFSGVSELGIIAGVSMFIGLGVSLTILPALLDVLQVNNVKPMKARLLPTFINELPVRQSTRIKVYSIIFALASGAILTQLVFDSNPINMRDPNSESVATIKELLKSKDDSPFALIALAEDLQSAQQVAKQLNELPSVHQTIMVNDLVALDQNEKLEILDELALILGHQLEGFNQQHIVDSNPNQAVNAFIAEIDQLQADNKIKPEQLEVISALKNNLNQLSADIEQPDAAKNLEHRLLSLLPMTLNRLKSSISAQAYTLDDLPGYLLEHWISPNKIYKILIAPAKDQNQVENLNEFVTEVQSVDPAATGLPVADQASGVAVVKAFIQAFSSALIAIFILLLIILRSLKDTLLIIGPLLLASLLTGAANVLLDNSFNFANIISLPLLMGMGVDSSIHILHRLKSGYSNSGNVLQSSTARGVFFSSLTTFCSFSSLTFNPHLGTASMGVLLAIGISFTLLCTLIVLPAFYGNRT